VASVCDALPKGQPLPWVRRVGSRVCSADGDDAERLAAARELPGQGKLLQRFEGHHVGHGRPEYQTALPDDAMIM
jgi:hypothetical protein